MFSSCHKDVYKMMSVELQCLQVNDILISLVFSYKISITLLLFQMPWKELPQSDYKYSEIL